MRDYLIPPPDVETLRFRSWPCEKCRQGTTTISYLIGCQGADKTFRTGHVDEKIAKEMSWLQDWINRCVHNYKQFPVVDLTHGSEHQVYLEQEFRQCVVKCTLPGLFGDRYALKDGKVWQYACTPYEYLVRLRLCRKLFGFAPQDVGILDTGQIVSIQDFVTGDIPSQEEVNDFLRVSGLTAVRERLALEEK